MNIYHSHTQPRVTVVAHVDNEGRAYYGVARASLKDTFNKKKGVLIAKQRATSGKHVDIDEDFDPKNFRDKAELIAKNIAVNPDKINGRVYKVNRKKGDN